MKHNVGLKSARLPRVGLASVHLPLIGQRDEGLGSVKRITVADWIEMGYAEIFTDGVGRNYLHLMATDTGNVNGGIPQAVDFKKYITELGYRPDFRHLECNVETWTWIAAALEDYTFVGDSYTNRNGYFNVFHGAFSNGKVHITYNVDLNGNYWNNWQALVRGSNIDFTVNVIGQGNVSVTQEMFIYYSGTFRMNLQDISLITPSSSCAYMFDYATGDIGDTMSKIKMVSGNMGAAFQNSFGCTGVYDAMFSETDSITAAEFLFKNCKLTEYNKIALLKTGVPNDMFQNSRMEDIRMVIYAGYDYDFSQAKYLSQSSIEYLMEHAQTNTDTPYTVTFDAGLAGVIDSIDKSLVGAFIKKGWNVMVGEEELSYAGVLSSMVVWYDVKKQGATNESLSANPVLTDFSSNGHDCQLNNFAFSGMSGVGGYGFTQTTWTITNRAESSVQDGNKFIFTNVTENGNLAFAQVSKFAEGGSLIRVRIKVDNFADGGHVRLGEGGNAWLQVTSNGEYTAAFHKDSNNNTTIGSHGLLGSNIEIEFLPLYPDALVFNGTAPTWVYNKSNAIIMDNVGTWIDNKTVCIGTLPSRNMTLIRANTVTGSIGESLQVTVPAFLIRVKGISDSGGLYHNVRLFDGSTTTFSSENRITSDGTYLIPAFNTTIAPADENSTPSYYTAIRSNSNAEAEINVDITVEFLPNYPAPTTNNYGFIPINVGSRCMMMDVVPLSLDASLLYDQRPSVPGDNFAIYTGSASDGYINKVAYSARNKFPTYINGSLNETETPATLTQRRQVISVNENNISTRSLINKAVVGASVSFEYPASMALYSMILFDRVLTEEEMRWVMMNLMGAETIEITTKAGGYNEDDGRYWATYSSDKSFVIPANVTVKTASLDENGLLLVEDYNTGDIVPAYTGVVVSTATPGTFTCLVTDRPGTVHANSMLKAAVEVGITEGEDCTFYRLGKPTGQNLGFWWGAPEGGPFTIGPNMAYMAVPNVNAVALEDGSRLTTEDGNILELE